MTQDELRALGERWKACPGFRWRPGMWIEWERPSGAGGHQWMPSAARVVDLPMGPLPITYGLVDPDSVWRDAWPVLSDPATRGVLLEDVREAWGSEWMVAIDEEQIYGRDGRLWTIQMIRVGAIGQDRWFSAASLPEALVCAREAAPR